MGAKPDPYASAAALVANAVTTARVMGENPRIATLVVSSIGRFAAELNATVEGQAGAESPGQALVLFALGRIDITLVEAVPRLHRGLLALLGESAAASTPASPPFLSR